MRGEEESRGDDSDSGDRSFCFFPIELPGFCKQALQKVELHPPAAGCWP